MNRRPASALASRGGKTNVTARRQKIAFITGVGTEIGRATALPFAREGAKVAIADIDAKSGEETAHLAGNEAIAIRADVTDPDSLQSAIRATSTNWPPRRVPQQCRRPTAQDEPEAAPEQLFPGLSETAPDDRKGARRGCSGR